MRLFTGLDVPYQMRRNLELLVEHLKPHARIQWSTLTSLHVTTKFIGEWPPERLDELTTVLDQVPRPAPLKIAIHGLGWFPNPHSPRVFFAAIQSPPELEALARATEDACEALGIAAERRPFQPHLTLARIREPRPLSELTRAIAALPNTGFGAYTAEAFHLYKSELRPGGSIYTKLQTYPFSA